MIIIFWIFFVFLLVILFAFLVLRIIFSILNPRNYFRSNKKAQQWDPRYSSSKTGHFSQKVFESSEGEYVEYEEIESNTKP